MPTAVATAQKVKASTKVTIVIGMFMAFFIGSSMMINAAVVTSPNQIKEITSPPDTQAPTVLLLTNIADATIYGSVDIIATIVDDTKIEKIELSLDGQIKFSETLPDSNWSFPLNTLNIDNGTHALLLKVYDSAGNSSITDPVIFNIEN